jgi:hypothetical protein
VERFRACFGDLLDPCTANAQRHDRCEILLIVLAATVFGAESCVDMALFGRAKPFLRRFLRLEGVPSQDAFSRVFPLLDRSRPASAAPLRPSPRRATRWWRSTARRRGAASTGRAGAGRCTWRAPGVRTTPQTTSPACASPSTSCERTPILARRAARSSAPSGMTPSSSKSSPPPTAIALSNPTKSVTPRQ